jgi:glycosyltransferase involved in cell wall biosynthesis
MASQKHLLTTPLRVVMFSQKIDPDDWLNSFTLDWVRVLAARVAHLDVIALEAHPAKLPDNVTVHSLGKERSASRLQQLLMFWRIVARLAPQTDIFFGHLTPRYTWLAAPLAFLYRVPQALWYTHQHAGSELRLGLWASRWILTAAPGSFPIPSRKVHIMGHGIDAQRFTPGAVAPVEPPLILAVGRISPIKHHHILVEAAARLRDQGYNAQFAIAGGVVTEEGKAYHAQLVQRIAELGLGDQFTLLGGLQGDTLVAQLRRASIVTNLSPVGLFDKAALEGMLVGRPVLVTNAAFDELLGSHADLLRAPAPDNVEEVTAHLARLLDLNAAERLQIGATLRANTLQAHSLDALMDRIVALWQNRK